jgi:hypothetical protein
MSAVLRDRLEEALLRGGGDHTLAELADEVRAGRAQCFHNTRAIVFTQIERHRTHSALRVYVAAGALEDVMSLQPEVEALALAEGCDRLLMIGRRGWKTVLPAHGWRETMVVYERPLEMTA